jgi:transposase
VRRTTRRTKPVGAPLLGDEPLYVGIDVGKRSHVAGFVSTTLLARHKRFEGCPALTFSQSRDGFRRLTERIQTYAPLEHCCILLERTGHYHLALLEYLLALDLAVYVVHVQQRHAGLLKTDKRDALGLANQLFNQLEKGIQINDKTQLVRRAVPPTEAALLLRGLVQHREELSREATQRRNKLTAICDILFPEFTDVFKDPNRASALAFRERFPTPLAIATATLPALRAARGSRRPSDADLVRLQDLARVSVGTVNLSQQRGLLLEQAQLIAELRLLRAHLEQLDEEIAHIVTQAREGRILLSLPGIGVIQAATLLAAIGHIANFRSAAALKSSCGWVPRIERSGVTLNRATLASGGNRALRKLFFLAVGNAIRMDCEWARLYERLVPRKCAYDERTQTYRGKMKVMGRIAGQMISTIYALLKHDQEVLAQAEPGRPAPLPMLYDPLVHQAHRRGAYRPLRPTSAPETLIQLPHASA